MSWNPNTATPDCDWCGECEWCNNLHRPDPPANDAGKRLAFYAMLAANWDDSYAKCTCGHYNASEHEGGACLITGCGCGAA